MSYFRVLTTPPAPDKRDQYVEVVRDAAYAERDLARLTRHTPDTPAVVDARDQWALKFGI